MSVEATSWAWAANVKSSAQRLILLSLADRAGETHKCYPSNKRLANDTRLNIKTVQKVVNELIEMKLVLDTGERKGSTNQVRVLQLLGVTLREQSQNRDDSNDAQDDANAPKNGTDQNHEDTQKRNSTEIGNNTENGTVEDTQNRDSLDDETIPKTGTLPVLTNPKTDTLTGVTNPILESNEPKNGICNEPNFGIGNLSLNLKRNLSSQHEWIPDQNQLIEKIKFAGRAREIELIFGLPSFEFELSSFNSYFENQAMSDSKKLHKFTAWIIDKLDRYKKINPEYGINPIPEQHSQSNTYRPINPTELNSL